MEKKHRRHSSINDMQNNGRQVKDAITRRISFGGPTPVSNLGYSSRNETKQASFIVNRPSTWKPTAATNNKNVDKKTENPIFASQSKTVFTEKQESAVRSGVEDEDVVEIVPEWKKLLFERKRQAEAAKSKNNFTEKQN